MCADDDVASDVDLLELLVAIRQELEQVAHVADEALRTGNPEPFAQHDLARVQALRDAALAALRRRRP